MAQKTSQELTTAVTATGTEAVTAMPEASTEKYPECEKLRRLKPQVDLLEDFLDWINERYYRLEPREGVSVKALSYAVHEFLGIDGALLDEERQRIIDALPISELPNVK